METAPSPLLLLLLLLLPSLAVVRSAVESATIILTPSVAPKSLPINYIQEVGSCAYKVTIATSCSSPSFTTGEIGVLFGDSHGNQIIEKKLNNGDKVFDSCNTDSFVLKDRPCSVEISYMYLYKDGAEDWVPNSVEISGSETEPLVFNFKSSIPSNTWFGFDLATYPFPPPSHAWAPPFPWSSPPPPPSLPPPPPEPSLPPPVEPIFPPPPPPPEPSLPPPVEPVFPPPPPPSPSSSSKLSGQKWATIVGILGLLTIALP